MVLKPKDVRVPLPVQLILDCHWLVCVRGEGLTDRSIGHWSKHKIGFLDMQIHSLPRVGALRAVLSIILSLYYSNIVSFYCSIILSITLSLYLSFCHSICSVFVSFHLPLYHFFILSIILSFYGCIILSIVLCHSIVVAFYLTFYLLFYRCTVPSMVLSVSRLFSKFNMQHTHQGSKRFTIYSLSLSHPPLFFFLSSPFLFSSHLRQTLIAANYLLLAQKWVSPKTLCQ